MIYTVTLNPAIDYIVKVEDFQVGQLNRMSYDEKFAGGKGINVSRVLKRIDVSNKAFGFLGGFTGGFIESVLKNEGVLTDFVQVDGDTRINIKLKSTTETEVNGQGPTISADNMDAFMKKMEQIKEDDILVLSGSIPASVPAGLYESLTKWGSEKGIHVVVDASGKTLLDVVKHKPFFVKPNHHELGELFDTKINSVDDVIPYGKKLVEMGAQHVIVSMAGDGAVLFTKGNIYIANVPKGKVINSVGAGDSLVAGFIGTYEKTKDIEVSFQTAVATGSATAFSADLCTKEKIEELLAEVKIEKK